MNNAPKLIGKADQEIVFHTPDGGERRILVHAGNMMLVQFSFPAGVTSTWHQHPHEQVGYVVSGEIDFCAENREPVRLGEGGSYYVAGGVWHNIITHTSVIVVDVFCPQREDFLV